MRANLFRPALLAVAVVALVAACSSSGSSAAPAASAETGAGGSITAADAWARAMAPGTTTSAVYVKLTNGTGIDDALVSVSTPATPTAEIHEVSLVSAAPAESSGMGGGMMGMHPIEKLPLPAGQTVELKPGSFHIMLIDVPEPLKDGSTIEVTLTFEKAPPLTLTVPVKMS
jgi:copper(I)-binding protein